MEVGTRPEEPKGGAWRCPRCGSVTWGALSHCSECGLSLTKDCPSCGGTWRFIYDYKFCPSCGAKTEERQL